MNPGKLAHRASRAVMKSHRFRISKSSLPIRLRPWFLIFTCIIMTILALLGFTNFARALPINDKILHFLCFAFATGVFYFIIDVEEEARRVWFWRHLATTVTTVICFFCGGILSEVVQSFLPPQYKEFDIGDVIANLLGSLIGILVAVQIDRYYRYRKEISRLYRPLDTGNLSDMEDDEDSTQLLPIHNNSVISGPKWNHKSRRLADIWDEREELFGIGPDSDSEDNDATGSRIEHASVPASDRRQIPKITVTDA
ncbi:hypothetical protein AMATHDRAFT_136769 [Amanita thiersii Skay4041]|uniref:VanZ-like domain-containing protein n=1 Tax=Amanita thiersii Skay4041 TaxID=703135 RepID=A0A2A9NZ56_9AGAR|nr:hypothetical protein AMATHDRAFT_136769 [Amanita thiersii Skay4041]